MMRRALAVVALCLATGCAFANSVGHHLTGVAQQGYRGSDDATYFDGGFIRVGDTVIGRFTVALNEPHRSVMSAERSKVPLPIASAGTASSGSAYDSADVSFNGNKLALAFEPSEGPAAISSGATGPAFNAARLASEDPGEMRGGSTISAVSAVPEPSTYAAMLIGLGFIALLARARVASSVSNASLNPTDLRP